MFNYFAFIQENNHEVDFDFLTWFIGFAEGDGSFIITKRGDLQFVITQGTADIQILELIKIKLGFGTVIKQGLRTSRFIVQDIKNLRKIILIFNGNIVFKTRQKRFQIFLENYNSKILKGKIKANKIELIEPQTLPNISNAWISGITDSEGCFTISFLTNVTNFRTRFIITQKGDDNLLQLSELIKVFNTGNIEAHSIKNNYSFIINGINNVIKIYDYFDKYPLKTKKFNSMYLWKELNKQISLKNHLNPVLRNQMIKDAKEINNIININQE